MISQGMQDDFKQDGLVSQLMKRIAELEAFEREFKLKQFGGFLQCARVYNSANQSINSGAFTNLNFNTERWDTDNIHDNALNNERLTCRTAGKYHITAQVTFDANAVGERIVLINSSTLGVIAQGRQQATPTYDSINCGADLDMAVGDYVTAQAYQASGGPLNVLGAAAAYGAEFMMHRVG